MYPILSPLIPAELLRDIAVVKKTGAKRSSADTFCYCNETCELCEKFKRHISITNCVRTAYKKDKEAAEDTVVVSCHLQNLVLLPRLPGYKESIFTSRLIAFNLSFVPLGKTKSNKCSNKSAVAVCWHEGIMGRKDEDICSGATWNSSQAHYAGMQNMLRYGAITVVDKTNAGPFIQYLLIS